MKKHYLILPLITLFFVSGALAAGNAVFYVSIDKNTYSPGDILVANIKIDADAGINASQATIQFPKDILEIEKTDKTGSIFSFWLREPDYSNDTGILVFTAGVDNSVSGKGLQVLKIVFRVKGSGNGKIIFDNAAITASDGSGTNILATMSGVDIVSSPKQETAQAIKITPAAVKSEPVKNSAIQTAEKPAAAENISEEKSLASSAAGFFPQSPIAIASILGMFAGLLLGYFFGKNFTISRKR